MEHDDIYDVTGSESGGKLTAPRINKKGRPTKAECLNIHKLDGMQTIPGLLEKGRTNEREDNP